MKYRYLFSDTCIDTDTFKTILLYDNSILTKVSLTSLKLSLKWNEAKKLGSSGSVGSAIPKSPGSNPTYISKKFKNHLSEKFPF